MRVQDIMVREFESVRPDTTLREAASRLSGGPSPAGGGLPALLVTEGGRLSGILTVADLLRTVLPPYLAQDSHLASLAWEGLLETQFKRMQAKAVREIMTAEVFTVQENAALTEAAELFYAHHVHSLPVMRGKELTGVLYLSDLARTVFTKLVDTPR